MQAVEPFLAADRRPDLHLMELGEALKETDIAVLLVPHPQFLTVNWVVLEAEVLDFCGLKEKHPA